MVGLLFALLSTAAFAQVNPWALMAENDLRAAQGALEQNHPGAVDDDNKEFSKWMRTGFPLALQAAHQAKSYEGYEFALRRFVNGFKDAHLGIAFRSPERQPRWPGFVLAYREKKFVVHSGSAGPAPGSVLIECDGRSPSSWMRENVFPYTGNEALDAHWIAAAPKLLVDYGNPFVQMPKKCLFETAGERRELALQWKPVSVNELEKPLKKAAFGEAPALGMHRMASGWWISLPTFWPEGEELAAMQKLIGEIKARRDELRGSETVVLDMRGNTGGSSEWGEQIARALWGEDYLARQGEKALNVDWRVSAANLKYLKETLPELKSRFGEQAEAVKGWTSVADGVADALKSKLRLFREPAIEAPAVKAADSGNPMLGKVFFLTDGQCVSACLDFADRVLAQENVIHIGQPTSADSVYMEIRPEPLPSGLATLRMAMKVYRGRPREGGKAYVPRWSWNKDMDDTPALEKWVSRL